LQHPHRLAAISQNDIGHPDQLGRVFSSNINIARAKAEIDLHVIPFDPVQFPQPLHKFRVAGLYFRIVQGEGGSKPANATYPLALLRARRER